MGYVPVQATEGAVYHNSNLGQWKKILGEGLRPGGGLPNGRTVIFFSAVSNWLSDSDTGVDGLGKYHKSGNITVVVNVEACIDRNIVLR